MALPTLATTHKDRAACRVKVALGQRQRLADPQPSPPEHDDQPPKAQPFRTFPGAAHDSDDFLDTRRIRRVRPLFRGGRPQ